MTIYYVDFLNGNDANAGTSFAARKKTLNSAANIAVSGDTIRIMKSPDPTSIGSATWANSTSITLPSALTAEVSKSQNTDWTVSANVTKTATTAVGDMRIGTSACTLSAATAFTTGVIAYAPCTTVNLSTYQQISLFFRNSIAIPANTIYLDLCSDSVGAVPVVSFALPAKGTDISSIVKPFTFDNGSALPSNINSIALRVASDQAAFTLTVSNIIACKAPSSADSITLNSIIGLNTTDEPEWYSIYGIDGTTVNLDITHNWVGSTGSLTTYKMEPIKISDMGITIPNASTYAQISQFSIVGGGLGLPVNIEGGWNTTDMSTQTGVTAFDFQVLSGRGFLDASSNTSVNKIISVRSNLPYGSSGLIILKIGEYHVVGGANNLHLNTLTTNLIFDKWYTTCYNTSSNAMTSRSIIGNTLAFKYFSKSGGTSPLAGTDYLPTQTINVKNLTYYGQRTVIFMINDGFIENYINNPSNATTTSFFGTTNTTTMPARSEIRFKNFTGKGPTGTLFNFSTGFGNTVSIENANFDNAPVLTSIGNNYYGNNYYIQNYMSTGLPKNGTEYSTFNAVTSPVHTAGGYSWEYKITSSSYFTYPLDSNYYKVQNQKIAEIPVKANKLITIKIWTRRLFTTTKAAFFVQPICSGINDYAVAESSAAGNTWEELTISFTPTINTVVPLYIGAQYDAVNASQAFYFDDLLVTIAD